MYSSEALLVRYLPQNHTTRNHSIEMRMYEPIWIRIKTHNTASLVTHPDNAARIKRAVIKEKNADTGYKLLLAEKALIAELVITQEESPEYMGSILINFSLNKKIKLDYLGVDNL